MNYTKHQIKRIRDLNDNYFEVVFAKKGLNFVPGSAVTLYNGPDFPVFIASGIQEPWIRLILNRDLFSPYFPRRLRSLKLNLEIPNLLNGLMIEETPSFVFDSNTIGAFFSWASTNAGKKCKVCYLGEDRVQEDWIKSYHTVVKPSNVSSMRKNSNLYVTGNRDLYETRGKKVLKDSKRSFILE